MMKRLKHLIKWYKEEGESSIAYYYIGLTYKRTENYIAAKKYLEKSLEMTPKIKGALIEIIDLLYRLGEYDEAKKWISIAEDEGVRPAQSKFLKGLTLQKSGDYEDAIQAFEEAKDLDDRLAQSATYQIGVTHLKMKNYKDAKAAFEDVFVIDPYSEIGTYADNYVDALDRKLEKLRPFHITARTAFEYDSNVLLKPTDSSLLSNITDEDDTRQIFDVKGDYTFRTEDNKYSLKTGYGIRVSKQNSLGNYDTIGNNISIQGNASFERMLFSIPVNYSHTIVDEKNYLSRFSAGNINNFLINKSNMIQAGIIYANDDYLRSTTIPGENRDGNELAGNVGWFWFFAENKGFVNARYTVIKDWTEGKNWEYLGHKIGASALYPFWDKFRLSLSGEVFLQNFDNTHTIYQKKREDQTYTVGTMFTYEIIKNLELQVRYTYVKEESNLDIYDYNRHIVSTGLQYKY